MISQMHGNCEGIIPVSLCDSEVKLTDYLPDKFCESRKIITPPNGVTKKNKPYRIYSFSSNLCALLPVLSYAGSASLKRMLPIA